MVVRGQFRGEASICVSVPARVSISVTNMNELTAGRTGGGNVGFAVDSRTSIEVAAADQTSVHFREMLGDAREVEDLIVSCVERWNKDEARATAGYAVTVHHLPPLHMGLGTSVAIQVALTVGLAVLGNRATALLAIRERVQSSYIEIVDGKPTPALTTGLASALATMGGFAFIGQGGEIRHHAVVPSWHYCVATPGGLRPTADVELHRTLVRGRQRDSSTSSYKERVIWNDLIPAIRDADFASFTGAVRALQVVGSKRVEIELHGQSVLHAIRDLYERGGVCAFMSAVGPGIVILTNGVGPCPSSIAEAAGLRVVVAGSTANCGIRLAIHTSSQCSD